MFLLVGLSLVGAAGAQEDDGADDERQVDRRVVIIKAEDGDELVRVHKGPFQIPLWGGGFLGVELTPLSAPLRVHFGVPEEAGVMVARVLAESPAERAGLEVGDIITAVDGAVVDSPMALSRPIREAEDGATVHLEVWRDGKVQALSAAVERRQPRHPARALFLHCDDEEEDCRARLDRDLDLDCGAEDCEVTVECHAGDCVCEVNGEARDCREIDGLDLEQD
jgi:hypothetical protein